VVGRTGAGSRKANAYQVALQVKGKSNTEYQRVTKEKQIITKSNKD
jgi:hypothetical protein